MQRGQNAARVSSSGSVQPVSPKEVNTANTENEEVQNNTPFPLLDVNHPLADGADLVFATPSGDRYYAHKQVVTLWSRQFKATFGQSIPNEFSGRVVCRVQEPSQNLELLLGCMYPSPASLEIQEDNIEAILLLADKYDVPGAFHQIDRWLMSRPYMVMPYHHWRTLPASLKMLHLNDAAQKFYLFVQHKGSQEFVEYMEQMEFPESCIQFVYKGMTHVGKHAFKKLSWAARLWLEFFAEDPELVNNSGILNLPPTSERSFSKVDSVQPSIQQNMSVNGNVRGGSSSLQGSLGHGGSQHGGGHGSSGPQRQNRRPSDGSGFQQGVRNSSDQSLGSNDSGFEKHNGTRYNAMSAPTSPRPGGLTPVKIKPRKSPFQSNK